MNALDCVLIEIEISEHLKRQQKPVQMNCVAYRRTLKTKSTNIRSFYVQEVGIMTINDCLMPNIFPNVCVIQRVENLPISLDTRTRVS